MKKVAGLVLALAATAAAVGCGPSQTSSERDAQQEKEQFKANQTAYEPYKGGYVGKITWKVNKIDYEQDVSIYIGSSVTTSPNPNRLANTGYPDSKGSLNLCFAESCFKDNPLNTDYARQYTFASAPVIDGHLILTTAQPSSCSTAPSDCESYTLDLQVVAGGLEGTIYQPSSGVKQIHLNKVN